MTKRRNNIIVIVLVSFVVLIAGMTTFIIIKNKLSQNTNRTSSIVNESQTYKKYAALKGEAYDKAFLANMIVHHESAMNMAEMASVSASRQEIKDLAFSISTSQGKEVAEMGDFQGRWGYPITSGHSMTDMENAGNSMEGMSMMENELKDLKGDIFDRKFLELMIAHHQDAIDMSQPAETNAQHQEVKNLAKAIIDAQTSEIKKMQMWQRNWGYQVTGNDNSMSGMSH
jgi:uncharacterized protein (DUF305 family)